MALLLFDFNFCLYVHILWFNIFLALPLGTGWGVRSLIVSLHGNISFGFLNDPPDLTLSLMPNAMSLTGSFNVLLLGIFSSVLLFAVLATSLHLLLSQCY